MSDGFNNLKGFKYIFWKYSLSLSIKYKWKYKIYIKRLICSFNIVKLNFGYIKCFIR